MASSYFSGLHGDRLKSFTSCMMQAGKFCHYHVNVTSDKTLLDFQYRKLLKAVGKNPKIYIVPHNIAEAFKKKYPDIRVQYIKSKVPEPRKHCKQTVRSKSANPNPTLD